DGSASYFESVVTPIKQDGQVVAMAIVASNVTRRVRVEKALRESEARRRLVINQTPAITWTTDLDLIFTSSLGASVTQIDLEPDQLVGTTLFEFFQTKDPNFEPIVAHRAALNGQSTSYETEWSGIVFDAHVQPLRDESGTVIGTIGAALDITERRQTEQAVVAAKERLVEHQLQETHRVEEELEKVREELVHSTRLATIGRMSAQIAHDLRNPLGAVRNAAYYLRRKTPPSEPKWAQYLSLIDREVVACDRIIRNLLTITRGKNPTIQPIHLDSVYKAVLGRSEVPPGVTVTFDCQPDPFVIPGDYGQFEQVLDNLIRNALEAVGDSGTITLQASRTEDDNLILIHDDGPGVAEDARDSVFDLFFTTKAKGSGLGLAICRQIIDRHGGAIELLPANDQGASLGVRLPRRMKQ
ncbi:MAG: ATP-binding protein, partial [Planctomycetales bacterium]